MLHIVSELMFAGVLAAGPLPAATGAVPASASITLPATPAAVPETLPDIPSSPSGNADTGTAPLGRPTPAERLGNARGGTGIASDTRLGGEVANNTANQVVTGANRIDTGSFSGSVGLPVVIQNSGANVLIQNATVINLQFK